MLQDFRKFVMRGNVLDLSVAVILGAAFGRIVSSLTDDILMPLIGKLFGGLDFSSFFLALGPIPSSYRGSPTDYAALKKAGVPLIGYGEFVTQLVNFLIVAFIIFLMVRTVNRASALLERETARLRHEEAAAPAPPAPDTPEVALLKDIRDLLQRRSDTPPA